MQPADQSGADHSGTAAATPTTETDIPQTADPGTSEAPVSQAPVSETAVSQAPVPGASTAQPGEALPPWRQTNADGSPLWTKNYQPGVPAEIELPTAALPELLERSVAQASSLVATEFFGAELTYGELGEQVLRVAEGLRRLGVRAGDRVAIILPNCPQHLIAFYAILRLGAVVVEHNPLYTARELDELFADHGARVAIVMDTLLETMRSLPNQNRPGTIVTVNLISAMPWKLRAALSLPVPALRRQRAQLSNGARGTTTWAQLLANPRLDADHPRPDVHDLAAIQYTSGTTGTPKGAMLTHYNLYANARQGDAWMHGATKGEQVSYAVLPFFHAFGITVHMTYGVLLQARQVLFPKPDVKLILAAAKKHPPTVFDAVPVLYQKTAEGAQAAGISLKSAKWCISGAMALPESVRELWESVSSGLLVEGYGLTEASPVALGNPFHASRRPGTIGVPFPSTLMKVVDPEDPSREVGVDEPGELMLKGPQVFSGYWRKPKDTQAALDADGWLHTGDIVTVDADGFTTIVDRLKEIIITGGFNISPSEVEAVLAQHDDIAEVAVVGLPSERGDEQVAAAVVLAPGARLDVDDIRAWAKRRLTPYKVPRRIVAVPELPRNLLGKVLRADVRKLLLADDGHSA